MNKKKTMIIVAVLMLAIGFASISATLLITGTIKIGVNEEDYDVIFTKAKIGDVDQTITQTNKTADTIEFETPVLKSIDDEAVLDYDVKNTSTQYDAKVKMKCYATNDTESLLNNYVSVDGVFDDKTVTFGSNATAATLSDEVVIEAQETKSGTITMKLIKSYAGTESSNETSLSIKCEMTAIAGEKSSAASTTTTTTTQAAPTYYYSRADGGNAPWTGDYSDMSTDYTNFLGGIFFVRHSSDGSDALCYDYDARYPTAGLGVQCYDANPSTYSTESQRLMDHCTAIGNTPSVSERNNITSTRCQIGREGYVSISNSGYVSSDDGMFYCLATYNGDVGCEDPI